MRFRIDVTIAVLAAISWGGGQTRCQSAPDLWHVGATQPFSEEIQFANGAAQLKGTVYLPKTGNDLAAVVVLHHAGLPPATPIYIGICVRAYQRSELLSWYMTDEAVSSPPGT